jgi:hypothetical protein
MATSGYWCASVGAAGIRLPRQTVPDRTRPHQGPRRCPDPRTIVRGRPGVDARVTEAGAVSPDDRSTHRPVIIDNAHPLARHARGLLLAWLAALALVLASVVPALGANQLVRLVDPAVSPRSAVSGTTVTFSVTYRNQTGTLAAAVQVRLGATTITMAPVGSTSDPRHGTVYRAAVKPPVGTYQISFAATDAKSRSATLSVGTLKITAAPSGGTSSGGTSSGGTSSGGSSSGGTSSGGSSSGGTSSGGTSSGGSSPGGSKPAPATVPPSGGSSDPGAPTSGTPSSTDPSTGPGAATPTSGAGATRPFPAISPAAAAEAAFPAPVAPIAVAPAVLAPMVGGAASGDGGHGGPSGTTIGGGARVDAIEPAVQAAIPGLRPPASPALVVTIFTTTFGGAAMAMAFLLFGKRRRDGQPNADDDVLSAAAASGLGVASSATVLEPAIAMPIPEAPLPTAAEAEMAMPRWRRPSLLEARKADPLRTASAPVTTLQFEHGLVAPLEGRERRCIRYRVVRLLDRPDELTAEELGVLDQGDEVQLLERSGAYWFVLCPDGRQGWVHRMVLGDAPEPGPRPGDGHDGGEGTFEWFQANLDRERATGFRSAPTADGAQGAAGAQPAAGVRSEWSRESGLDLDLDEDVIQAYRDARAG